MPVSAPPTAHGDSTERRERVPQTANEKALAEAMARYRAAEPAELMQQSIGPAFPVTPGAGRSAAAEAKHEITVRLKGVKDLRRAMLWREILERPRAFDL